MAAVASVALGVLGGGAGSGSCTTTGQFLALAALSALAAFCGHSLAGCLPKHSMHTCAKWHLAPFLQPLAL